MLSNSHLWAHHISWGYAITPSCLVLVCQVEQESCICVSNLEKYSKHTSIYGSYGHLRQQSRGELSTIKRSRKHNSRNCTILHDAEESWRVLWGTLIRAHKIAISLETTQRTGNVQCRVTKDYLEVDQKNYTGNDKQGRETQKQKERKVNLKKIISKCFNIT